MHDLSYTQALEAAPEPHTLLLGPAPCIRCGAWVEWAGVEWLALGTLERHDCAPYLVNGLYRLEPTPREYTAMAHPMSLVVAQPPDSGRLALAVVIGAGLILLGLAWAADQVRVLHGG